jgi:hypothetical protein
MTTICALTVPSVVRPATAKRDVSARAFGAKKAGGVAAAVPRAGQTYADVGAAVDAGLLQASAPFEDGIDLFGFFKNIDQAEAQRYADVEITHGRLAMLASVGFIVGEQVEGSSFLFDAQVTGPGRQPLPAGAPPVLDRTRRAHLLRGNQPACRSRGRAPSTPHASVS